MTVQMEPHKLTHGHIAVVEDKKVPPETCGHPVLAAWGKPGSPRSWPVKTRYDADWSLGHILL